MDTAQWSQKIGLMKPMEDLVTSTTTATVAIAGVAASSSSTGPEVMERTRVRPQKEQALNCPRCNSTNTKFCYYNNYSLTQPRYFCKNCRRYWTAGGSLRNVPVGGGSRKNKRSSSLSSSSSAATSTSSSSTAVAISNASKKLMATDHHLISPAMSLATTPSQAPSFHEGKDLSLAFPAEFSDFTNNSSSRSNTVGSQLSAMDLLRNGMAGRSLGPFVQMPMPMSEYPAGFGLQDQLRRPAALSFSLDGIGAGSGGGYGSMQGVHESDSGGRMVVPFEDLKPAAPSGTAPPDQFQLDGVPPAGFWSGMIGGSGGSW